jgi:hypothetical protein
MSAFLFFFLFFSHSYLMNLFGLMFTLISVFDSFVFSHAHGSILNDIEGVRIPCLCILYSMQKLKFMHEPWGASLFHLNHFWLLSSYLVMSNWFFVSLDCLLSSLVEASFTMSSFSIFDPQYGLTSSKYC